MDYRTANAQLQGRNYGRRKVGNNTYLVRRGDAIAVQLHGTDVVTYHPNGDTVLDSGGWRTATTKERMTRYGGQVHTDKGVWYVWGKPYADGITQSADGTITGQGTHDPKGDAALKRRVKAYAALCADSIPLDAPSGGDCWYCYLHTEDGQPLGEATRNVEHLESHMEEGYVAPSLVAHVLQRMGSRGSMWGAFDPSADALRDHARDMVKRTTYRYIMQRMGYAA